MPGGFGSPYRPPCGGWPVAPKLYLGCGHHIIPAHKTIQRYINTTLAPNDPCTPQVWAFPTPRPANETAGSGQEAYSECQEGNPVGAWPEPFPENTYALPPSDQNQFWDASLCGKVGFKNVIAEKQWHGSAPISSQEYNGGARWGAMNGDGSCPTREAAVNNPPDTRYLTMAVFVKHKVRVENSTYPGGDETVQSLSSTCTVDRLSGKQTGSVGRTTLHDKVDEILADFFNFTHDDVIDIYGDHHGTIPGGVADSYTDGASPSFSWTETEEVPSGISQPSSTNTTTISGGCGFGDNASVSVNTTTTSVVTSSPTYGYSDTSSSETITATLSPAKFTYVRNVTSTAAADPETPGDVAESNEETWEITITLSNPYTHTQLHADVNELLATWNLGDDAQYPWRYQIDNAYSQIFSELNSNNIGTSGGPLVTRNERGPTVPGLWPYDIEEGVPYVDESLPPRTEYPDGGIVGAPLPTGYEYFFDFRHIDYRFEFDLTETSILGIPRNFGAISPWRHATQWFTNQECRWFPTGPWTSYKGIRNPEAFTTDGSPILIPRSGLIKSKWAEIHHRRYLSHNYFRPCGADRNELSGEDIRWPDAWPICGRIAIVSATQNGGNVDIILAEPATYLETGDLVDFTTVAGLGTGLTATVTDSTHFSVPGTLTTSPTLGGYVSSNGAPSYGWNDDQRKGDFVYKVFTNDFRDFLESYRQRWDHVDAGSCSHPPGAGSPVRHLIVAPDSGERNDIGTGSYWLKTVSCSQQCLPASPCDPAVIYVSPNTETGHANSVTLTPPGEGLVPDETYGSFWCAHIEQAMANPLGLGDLVEARCAKPDGAPDLPSDALSFGCAGYVAGLNADPQTFEAGQCAQQYEFTLEYWDEDEAGGNTYRIFGQPLANYPFSHVE